jgi:hypothetical protein
MPFRQASQIGKDELDDNDPLLIKQGITAILILKNSLKLILDSDMQLPSCSENTSNETMIFSPTLDELPSH